MAIQVDQIQSNGAVVQHVDVALSEHAKTDLLLRALPGAHGETYCGVRVVRFKDQIILKAQVTHLGNPWPTFKKRIQIPPSWLVVEKQAAEEGLTTRFIGVYHHFDVTIFVAFDPRTYVLRRANNSAAHVSTNDLYQAQTAGTFARVDRNGNRLASVRGDLLAAYLAGGLETFHAPVEVFRKFNREFLDGERIDSLDAVRLMHESSWPDKFQAEWPGFFLEYRLDTFLRRSGLDAVVRYQKVKSAGSLDYDLAFGANGELEYYGDLKASNQSAVEAPGNDATDLFGCVREFGKFWYVIYEHETWHARNYEQTATIAWNEWRRSAGHKPRKGYNPLSYSAKFKAAVRFDKMMILEINAANFDIVLGDFAQGAQPDGADRALKVMINKRNIDNFLIYSEFAGMG